MGGSEGVWPLEVALQVSDGVATVEVAGELDVFSLGQFNAAVDEARRNPVTKVVIDLSEVSFMGSRALGTLVKLAGDSRDQGLDFAIRNPSEPVKRTQRLAGVAPTEIPVE